LLSIEQSRSFDAFLYVFKVARARRFKSRQRLVKFSRQSVAANGLETQVRIEHEDIFTLNLSGADVITVFLYPRLMERLLPQLQKLKPGARIVSHQFEMPILPPQKAISVESKEDSEPHRLFLWTAPLTEKKPGSKEAGQCPVEPLCRTDTVGARTAMSA